MASRPDRAMTSLHPLSNTILSIINNAIIIVGPDDQITFANHKAAAMFRTGQVSQLIGQSVFRLFMPDDKEIMAPNLLHLARNAADFEEEVMMLRFDGARFIALISTSQYRVEDRASVILSIHNVSGLKGIEKALKHTERVASLGRMLDDINHQIRNPVSVIGGFAHRLLKREGADNRYAQAILDEAERLESLLDTLRAFSQVPPPKVTPVALSDLAREITTLIGPRAEAAGVPLTVHCPDDLGAITVSIDQELLLQAIAAVVDNACEASVVGEHTITMEIGRSGKSLPYRISIMDQGCGIEPIDQAKVFAPFFTRKTRHHGMGLTLAQKIITEQGGEMILESTPGQGCVAHLFLTSERRRPIRTKRLEPA